jgi:hypothetical protein
VKSSFRTLYIGFIGIVGAILSLGGLISPKTGFGEDNLSVVILSNLRAFTAAELMMALFALYSLSRKQYQDMALTFFLLTLVGWTIGQVSSYIIDGAPNSITVVSIVIQAALIPVTWMALKKK